MTQSAGSNSAVSKTTVARLNQVSFSYDGGQTWALDNLTMEVHAGEHLCILGANGSGKSTLGSILSGATAPDRGQVELMGRVVCSDTSDQGRRIDTEAYRQARRSIGMVFQNPEDQIVTTVVQDDVAFGPENLGLPRQKMLSCVPAALRQVDLQTRMNDDPTRMSGGQQQRLALAGSLAMNPGMMVLDEPGAMLDAAGRQEIQSILCRLTAQGTAVVHITHLLEQARQADRVLVLDHGRIVASGRPDQILNSQDLPALVGEPDQNPLTQSSTSDTDAKTAVGNHASPMVKLSDVSYSFPDAGSKALSQVNLELAAGRTLAIIGRNGSGKSTLARLICALAAPDSGSIQVAGLPLAGPDRPKAKHLRRQNLKLLRQRVGYVMQYPEHQLFADTVAQDIAYGPHNLGYGPEQVQQRVDEAMKLLDISDLADRSPFDLSGGQRRLVAIAGVVACSPQLLVLDEATASLDPQACARIMRLLRVLHQRGVTIVMSTHADREALDLADQTLLLEHGETLDYGPTVEVVERYHQLLATDTAKKDAAGKETAEQETNQAQTDQKPPSLLARLDPRAKLVTFLLAMFTAFAISTPAQLVLALVVTVGLFAAARAPLRSIMNSVKGFLILMLLLALFNLLVTQTGRRLAAWGPFVLTTGGIWVAVLYACRFMLIIFLGALLVETTTPTQMTDACESLLSPLSRLGIHTNEIALVLSLALRFIPTLGREVQAIVEAQAARGGSIESGSLSQRLHAAIAITVPVFAGALRHADNLSRALDARCYEGSRQERTHYRLLRLGRMDILFIALMAFYLLALLLHPLF
ncbi:energy-coupling factor transporter ATPase [Bifidobacterium choladohabitans]|uniref:energy-coupling factor transporter ATPase n=1 Tax=Bifidobacterium choladohabitans TaxID=2750947 RepID=UPI0018DCBBF8|nr:energy-coupling factor transporter ATPase [Bifidobacterium choladohabitans]MBI0047338.1 ATP-binding cassette domain-containing protein [Bifidobacterium choladohabitans]